MREIKFRALRLGVEKMVFGCYFTGSDEEGVSHYIGNLSQMVNPKTVGQFTGFKDKNGVDIYEGDIVEFEDGVSDVVIWNDLFQFHTKNNYVSSQEDFNESEAVVIGNIHQNPELLNNE